MFLFSHAALMIYIWYIATTRENENTKLSQVGAKKMGGGGRSSGHYLVQSVGKPQNKNQYESIQLVQTEGIFRGYSRLSFFGYGSNWACDRCRARPGASKTTRESTITLTRGSISRRRHRPTKLQYRPQFKKKLTPGLRLEYSR